MSRVEGRLPTARLGCGKVHLDAEVLQHLHRRFAHPWEEEVHQAGDEEGDSWSTLGRDLHQGRFFHLDQLPEKEQGISVFRAVRFFLGLNDEVQVEDLNFGPL